MSGSSFQFPPGAFLRSPSDLKDSQGRSPNLFIHGCQGPEVDGRTGSHESRGLYRARYGDELQEPHEGGGHENGGDGDFEERPSLGGNPGEPPQLEVGEDGARPDGDEGCEGGSG